LAGGEGGCADAIDSAVGIEAAREVIITFQVSGSASRSKLKDGRRTLDSILQMYLIQIQCSCCMLYMPRDTQLVQYYSW
jgi:hypothetical protein